MPISSKIFERDEAGIEVAAAAIIEAETESDGVVDCENLIELGETSEETYDDVDINSCLTGEQKAEAKNLPTSSLISQAQLT